jgi:pimeloyl-ACP methyl ester carboxylesterase
LSDILRINLTVSIMQEKKVQIGSLSVNYKIIGAGKVPIVLLHGWGISSDKYIATAESILEKDSGFVFYIPDLPGFGKTPEPPSDWRLDDYVEFSKAFVTQVAAREGGFEPIKDILEKNVHSAEHTIVTEHKRVIMIAHSNGGRIAIKYALRYPEDLESLVLTGAAGIKHELTFRQSIFYHISKAGRTLKKLPLLRKLENTAKAILYAFMREKDYANASVRMKAVMRNALDEDLTGMLEKISTPTLLIWGRNDNSTPLEDGRLMHERIKGSQLRIIDDANHSAPYNNAEEFAAIFTTSPTPPNGSDKNC